MAGSNGPGFGFRLQGGLSGLRRAMALRPGLTAAIVHPGEGIDMNDLLMGATPVSMEGE